MLLKFWGSITQMPNLPAPVSDRSPLRQDTHPTGRVEADSLTRNPRQAPGNWRRLIQMTLNNMMGVGPAGPNRITETELKT